LLFHDCLKRRNPIGGNRQILRDARIDHGHQRRSRAWPRIDNHLLQGRFGLCGIALMKLYFRGQQRGIRACAAGCPQDCIAHAGGRIICPDHHEPVGQNRAKIAAQSDWQRGKCQKGRIGVDVLAGGQIGLGKEARIEPGLKKEADAILAAIGMNATTAITLFYTQMVRHRGFPLELKIPNDETLEAMREVRDPEFRKNAPRYASAEELFAALRS
jgi:DNA-damage-inducible protein J